MTELRVKNEFLPERCEVCHQTDCFDAETNWCARCKDAQNKKIEPVRQTDNSISSYLFRVTCFLGIHKWHYLRWERYCERCSHSQHVWRVLNNSIVWRDTEDNNIAAVSLDATPLPLLPWQCTSCQRPIMSVHPPGYFEPCPYCGKTDFVSRKYSKDINKGLSSA